MNETDNNRPIFAIGICNIGCDQSHATFQTIVPGGAVKSVASSQSDASSAEPKAGEEPMELCHLIHPSVSDKAMQWQIHREIENLVSRHSMMDICQYLTALANEHKILLPRRPTSPCANCIAWVCPKNRPQASRTRISVDITGSEK